MKTTNLLLVTIALTSILWISCKKDDDNEDGLSEEIHNIVPDAIIDKMKDNGMPIHEGKNPPSIENIYHLNPCILVSSTVSDKEDTVGREFADGRIKLYEQDNETLTIKVIERYGSSSGIGYGSFLSGSGNKFSVFAKSMNYDEGDSCSTIIVYSGTNTMQGIRDLYYCIYMVNNYDNPHEQWIEEGTGRILKDGDGMSEIINSLKSEIVGNKSVKEINLLKKK
jgi:hypothetical protein